MQRVRLAEAVALLALAAAPAAAGSAPARYVHQAVHMGVEVRVVLWAEDSERAATAFDAAFARIANLDAVLSDYREDSGLNRLSARAGGGPQAVGPDLYAVLAQAHDLSRRSGGAFDPAVGPLSRLWRRARRRGELPEPERLREARALAGPDLLALDPAARTAELLRPGMRLDLGGIAKGWAADAAAAELSRHGIARALVAIAGDVRATAPPPGEPGWRVALSPPDGADGGATLLLADAAVSTSGDAEQFVVIDGVRYSHIVDPRTGLGLVPSRQVTVVAPNAATADGLATAACVLGPEAGLALVDAVPGAAAAMWLDGPGGPTLRVSRRWPAARTAAYSQRSGSEFTNQGR